MTLNRIPEDMRKDILNLQLYYELTERMKNNDRYHYWESRRRSNLYFKTMGFIKHINNTLNPIERAIFYMRYVFKYPIMKVAKETKYSKRMIQYKLNDIIVKLEEDPEMYRMIKKMNMEHTIIKSYVAHNTPKKVQ
ncbi:hypothetical protein [Clostridium fermenticellae]|nr:hypothetical protein [Clostridium fermenticellae]